MNVKCNLIIDSCCDLPPEIVNVEGVCLLKFPFQMSNGGHMDDLFQSMTAHEFYEGMRKGEEPQTAQIPVMDYVAAFTWACESGVPTVFLSFSGGLTGSFETAQMTSEQVKGNYPDAELYLVDTRLASTAEALLVYEALRQRERGLTARELYEWAREARYYVNNVFMVDSWESLRRGGRIPAAVASASAKLDVKPLLCVDVSGKLSVCGVVRGRKKGIKQMVAMYEKETAGSTADPYLAIGHADCPRDLKMLHDLLGKVNPNALIIETQIGPVIGSHVGPDMISLVWWGGDRRETTSVADRIARRITGK